MTRTYGCWLGDHIRDLLGDGSDPAVRSSVLLQFALNVQRHSPQTSISLELVALQHLEWFRPLHELLVLALAAIYHKLSMKSLHVDGGDERRHSVAHAQHDMMDVFDGADKHQTG